MHAVAIDQRSLTGFSDRQLDDGFEHVADGLRHIAEGLPSEQAAWFLRFFGTPRYFKGGMYNLHVGMYDLHAEFCCSLVGTTLERGEDGWWIVQASDASHAFAAAPTGRPPASSPVASPRSHARRRSAQVLIKQRRSEVPGQRIRRHRHHPLPNLGGQRLTGLSLFLGVPESGLDPGQRIRLRKRIKEDSPPNHDPGRQPRPRRAARDERPRFPDRPGARPRRAATGRRVHTQAPGEGPRQTPIGMKWSLLDSNQRPLRCERSALPTELSDLFGQRRAAGARAGQAAQYPHGESNPGLLAENQVS